MNWQVVLRGHLNWSFPHFVNSVVIYQFSCLSPAPLLVPHPPHQEIQKPRLLEISLPQPLEHCLSVLVSFRLSLILSAASVADTLPFSLTF